MKRKIHTLSIITSLCILFGGCADRTSDQETGANQIRATGPVVATAGHHAYDNGLLYHEQDMAMFLDFATMRSVPLCNKPNCLHEDSTCVAKSCVANTTLAEPILYQNQIYYFTSENEIIDAENGKSQTFSIHSTCYCSDIQTGETEIFLQFDDYNPTGSYVTVLIGSKWYFIASDNAAYEKEDGTWYFDEMGGKQYFCCIDLETAEFQNFGLVNDSPYAENNYVREGNHTGNFCSQVIIEGVYDNKIYMYYQYVEDQEDLLSVVYSGGDVWTEVPWVYESKVYDIEENSLTTSDVPAPATVDTAHYIYWDEASGRYRELGEGSGENLTGFQEAWSPQIVNGKMWNLMENDFYTAQVYDFMTDEVIDVRSPYVSYDSTVYAYYEDRYIVSYMDENEEQKYAAVSENELIGG